MTDGSTCTHIEGSTYLGLAINVVLPPFESAGSCANACAAVAGCTTYTFDGITCALLYAALSTPTQASPEMSAGKCNATSRSLVRTLAAQKCTRTANLHFIGADLALNIPTGDDTGCAALCTTMDECTHYTFIGGQCYPKRSDVVSQGVEAGLNAVSGICSDSVIPTAIPTPAPSTAPTPSPSSPTADTGSITTTPQITPSTPATTSSPDDVSTEASSDDQSLGSFFANTTSIIVFAFLAVFVVVGIIAIVSAAYVRRKLYHMENAYIVPHAMPADVIEYEKVMRRGGIRVWRPANALDNFDDDDAGDLPSPTSNPNSPTADPLLPTWDGSVLDDFAVVDWNFPDCDTDDTWANEREPSEFPSCPSVPSVTESFAAYFRGMVLDGDSASRADHEEMADLEWEHASISYGSESC